MATTPACLGSPHPLNSLISLSQTLTISLSRRPASTDLPIFSLSNSGGNYPPMTTSASLNLPLTSRWDYGGGALDRAKGNKRNWILVWEDGFSDFYKCEKAGNVKGRFGANVFFKMSHEVYSYSEGMVGK
ncbi:uncharacterized protein LOC114257985 [Camellia sinensis]|uniref:uncharacterized protein LOC114257985 n=1 Tax=Camellia sinensis TaxID=4442 RepID=UPI001036CD18|nr:uncharacterized protein LOC114257985 [Camellia sinensis]